MYCNNCGEEIKDGKDFCPVCGNKIIAKATSSRSNKTVKEIGSYAGASENATAVKKKVQNVFEWYTYNWKRVFSTRWNGVELKHHVIWSGIHIVTVIVVLMLSSEKADNNEPIVPKAEYIYEVTKSQSATKTANGVATSKNNWDTTSITSGGAADDLIAPKNNNNTSEKNEEKKNSSFSDIGTGTWYDGSGKFEFWFGVMNSSYIVILANESCAGNWKYSEVGNNMIKLESVGVNLAPVWIRYSASGENLRIDYYVDWKQKDNPKYTSHSLEKVGGSEVMTELLSKIR